MTTTTPDTALIRLAGLSWQLARVIEHAMANVSFGGRARLDSRLRYLETEIRRTLTSAGIEIIDLTGQAYTEGLSVSVVNLEDFQSDQSLVISQMLEPTLTRNGQVLAIGRAAVSTKEG